MIENETGATPATETPVNTAETETANQEVRAEAPTESSPEQKEPTYTKSQVIEMMRKRVERSHNAFFKRYGVKDLSEMDTAFGKIADYEKQIADLGVTNSGLIRDNAFLKHNISPERYGDIDAYFKGKDMKIDSDTLAQEVITHPEWVKAIINNVPQTSIKTLSPERSHEVVESEDEKMKRIFGV